MMNDIEYPEKAREEGLEGRVIIRAFVDSTGDVTSTEIIKGVEGLDAAAVDAVMKRKFRPAKYKDTDVGVWIAIPIDFKIAQDSDKQ